MSSYIIPPFYKSVPNYNIIYNRFSPSDWSASNIDHYNSADASRNQNRKLILKGSKKRDFA